MITGNIHNVPDSTLAIVNQILQQHKVKITKDSGKNTGAFPEMETPVSMMRKKDVCRVYHVSNTYLQSLVKAGKLKAHKTGTNKQCPIYFEIESLNAYFAGRGFDKKEE